MWLNEEREAEHGEGRGRSMYQFVRAHESSARTYADAIDRVIERGYLCRVFDTTGRDYLDCLSCAGTLATGHNHPVVMDRVREFLSSGHVLQALDVTTPAKAQFLDELLRALPEGFAREARVQFCGPTGADAVEAAIKLFKTVTGRRSVITFQGGYHGMSNGALSLTGHTSAREHVAGGMADVHFMPYPYSYRCPFGLGGSAGEAASLHYIERALKSSHSGITKPAAVILEVVQGEGGVVPAPLGWLRLLGQLTRELDIPLIIDEVQTGIGRTGTMFAFEAAGILPDAVIISKAIGGGFPLSLVAYHERYNHWEPGAHAGTFRGNQIAMVAGAATLEVIRTERLVAGAAEKGEYLGTRLRELGRGRSYVGDVRGRGLMWGVEIVQSRGTPDALGSLPPDGERARAIRRACLEEGLILETGGLHGSVLRLLPPLVITLPELDEAVAKLTRAMDRVVAPAA